MKILITGALGHIGSCLIRKLPASFPGSTLVLVDNLMTQRYSSLFNLPAGVQYRFYEMNVLDSDVGSLFSDVDVVVHLAAITNAAGSFDNAEEVEHNNFNATKTIAEACAQHKVPLIHLSSTSVYGTQQETVDENCSEEELKPQSPYAETKLREERLLARMGVEVGLRYVVCRFGTICGVSPGMRFHTAVNKFCWQAVMKQPITVWRTALDQKRPYLSLTDACSALAFIMQNASFDNAVYNILTDNRTVNDIVSSIRTHVRDLRVEFVDTEIMNQLSYQVENEKFKQLGFSFQGSIDDDIKATLQLLSAANGGDVT